MHLFFDTLPEEKKNTMENNEDDRRGWPEEEEPIKNNPPTKGYSTYTNPASGSVAAPTWYTENEMYDWLTRNNYHENIAKELSSKWAADLQGAFNKGFEKGTRELKEREEALKELLPLIEEPERLIQECIMDYSEVKFCPIRQGKGNQCRHCFDKAIIERARKTLNP